MFILVLFSVSVLTVLHSMFLSHGKVVFFPFIILFKLSNFFHVLVLGLCCLVVCRLLVWSLYFQKLAVHFEHIVVF